MGTKNKFYADIMSMHKEVTGSCNLVVVTLPNHTKIRFIVDCGLYQEQEYEELNSELLFEPGRVEFCLVTHNHIDHTGKLPLLLKNGFRGGIFTTESTCKLLPLALHDSYKVLKEDAKKRNVKCIYSEEDVEKALQHVIPCEYNRVVHTNEYIKVHFFQNGHLMGAALVLVRISYPGYEDINLLFTGDYNEKNLFFDIEALPRWVVELPLTVIQESTYGDMDSVEIQKTFQKNIRSWVDKGGTVVIPVFSLGRAQEILYELKCMQDESDLNLDVPIYLDGKLAIRYTRLYLHDGLDIKEEMQNFLPKNLKYVSKDTRLQVVQDNNKKIILTTSGMGSYGPAQTYIPEYIVRENALIHFTGYTAEGTLGGNLKNAETDEIVKIGGVLLKKKARVEYTNEFSAHAKADEMIHFLQQFKDLKLVLVNHGETQTKDIFAKRILDEVETKKVGILGRDYLFRVDAYGLIKTFPTKFK